MGDVFYGMVSILFSYFIEFEDATHSVFSLGVLYTKFLSKIKIQQFKIVWNN